MARRTARLIVGALLATALLLVLLDARGSGPTQALRGVAGTVAGPPERVLAWVRDSVADRFGSSQAQRERIAQLEAELSQARTEAGAAAAGRLTRAQERELAALVLPEGYVLAAGRVVSVSASQDVVRSVAISLGSSSGMRSGLAVLGVHGLAGVTETVSGQVSTVRLVVDQATELAVRVAGSGEVGVVRGTGAGGRLTLLDPQGDMAVGDLVVTLGTPNGAIPAGLPIGRISAVTGTSTALDRVAEVAPNVDDSTLDEIDVLVPAGAQADSPATPGPEAGTAAESSAPAPVGAS